MKPKVSIIVPVYNAEPYIAACIRSLLNQTLPECEFILINDGSTDSSPLIMEQFARTDSRIVVIHQRNEGVSMARNAGLRAAGGEYVGFVDADDRVEPDMYETLYRAAYDGSCDAVVSNMEFEMEGRKVIATYPFAENRVLDRTAIEREVLPLLLESDSMNSCGNKIYRRSVIERHQVKFPEKVALGEDGQFNVHFFGAATSMIYVNYAGYHYREVAGSATRNMIDQDYFARALEVYRMEPPAVYKQLMTDQEIASLRSKKLIRSVMAYIYMYLRPMKDVRFSRRYVYVRRMIRHPAVQEAVAAFDRTEDERMNRYDRSIVACIKARSMAGLIGAVTYSRLRNAQFKHRRKAI